MRYGERTAALRRILISLVDSNGDPVTGAAPSGSELTVSLSGGAWGAAGGSWAEVGEGAYYYEAAIAETRTGSFLAVRAAPAGAVPRVVAVDIGDRIAPTADAGARRVLLYFVDSNGDPVDRLDLGAATIEVSIAGAAWAAAAGVAGEIDDGAYYYELAPSERVPGPGMVRVEDPAIVTSTATWNVLATGDSPAAVAVPLPVDPEYAGPIAVIDHVTSAVARMPHQYRGRA